MFQKEMHSSIVLGAIKFFPIMLFSGEIIVLQQTKGFEKFVVQKLNNNTRSFKLLKTFSLVILGQS